MAIQVNFNLTDELAARLSVAYGRELNLTDGEGEPRNADMAEFKAKLSDMALGVMYRQERRAEQGKIIIPSAEIT